MYCTLKSKDPVAVEVIPTLPDQGWLCDPPVPPGLTTPPVAVFPGVLKEEPPDDAELVPPVKLS
jgi:hypothetical protein